MIPWHFQTIVSSIELASLFLLPAGDAPYAGVLPLSPKTILPPLGLSHQVQRPFGLSLENPARFVKADCLTHGSWAELEVENQPQCLTSSWQMLKKIALLW